MTPAPYLPVFHPPLTIDGDPLARAGHLGVVLGINDRSLTLAISQGKIPQPDVPGGRGRARMWRISSLQKWSPPIAGAVERLVPPPPLRATGRLL